ncbi:hypothetical protein OCAE111667_26420 [Occultella aeris]|uniref:Uncharacterized protein n=1 Tax=Occultella aeris TaxID=2761496 RepID=A0A7M4DEP8_9MICO|nr:hypothetical protein HALOF300_00588 [Occultella aeris]
MGAGTGAAAVPGADRAGGRRACRPGVAGGRGAARPGRLRAGVLRGGVGRRRPERVRHPQRRPRGLARRRRARPVEAVPGGLGDPGRPLHRSPRAVRAGTEHQRRGADRPRGRPRRRLAQGRIPVATGARPRVRERPRQPDRRGRPGQSGQGCRRRRGLAPAEHRVPLCLRRSADPGEGHVRAGRQRCGVRCAGAGARAGVPGGAGCRGCVVGRTTGAGRGCASGRGTGVGRGWTCGWNWDVGRPR